MNATVLPFHRRRTPRAAPERTYAQGWIDGAAYVERWRAWGWRLEGFAVGAAIVALAFAIPILIFGGRS